MALLSPEISAATKAKLEAELTGPVTIHFFTREAGPLVPPDGPAAKECPFCRETRQLLEEAAALSEKISLRIHDFQTRKDLADEFGVDKVPAILVAGGGPEGPGNEGQEGVPAPRPAPRIRFFGIPSGYEYGSLVEALIDASRGTTNLGEATRAALKTLKRDVRIRVFVMPTCPYCTLVVRLAHRMAVESPRITSEMVESAEFPDLARQFAVFSVPKTVLNDILTLDGAISEDKLLEQVLKAAGAEPAPGPAPTAPASAPKTPAPEPGA